MKHKTLRDRSEQVGYQYSDEVARYEEGMGLTRDRIRDDLRATSYANGWLAGYHYAQRKRKAP